MAKKAKTTKYGGYFNPKQTPQAEPIPGRTDMVENNAGGYTWEVDAWKKLDRFLVLGAERGTYYQSERKLTIQNADNIVSLVKSPEGKKAVDRIVEISQAGRAPKQSPAIFALAIAASFGTDEVRSYAMSEMPKVCRTGTHLFEFLENIKQMRGWGRALKKGVAKWFLDKDLDTLALQTTKYRQRGGWTHRDVMRKAHPKTTEPQRDAIFGWVTQNKWPEGMEVPRLIDGYQQACVCGSEGEMIKLITDYNLPWELVPTGYLGSAKIWEALLPGLPYTATLRNLGRMTENGLLQPLSDAARMVVERLLDAERMKRARVHPIAVLSALTVYSNGGASPRAGFYLLKSSPKKYSPVQTIVDALNDAYYLSFGNVEPVGKPLVLGIDVSSSMCGQSIAGIPGLTANMGAAAMCMVIARTEKEYAIIGFTRTIRELNITPKDSLQDALKKTQDNSFGGTDCAQPMLWAMEKGIRGAEGFAVYTDNETWAGKIHPSQALQKYREFSGKDARLATVGLASNGFTIADPKDAGMIDVVGFDIACPNLISSFFRQEF